MGIFCIPICLFLSPGSFSSRKSTSTWLTPASLLRDTLCSFSELAPQLTSYGNQSIFHFWCNLIETDMVHFPSHLWWWGSPAFLITSHLWWQTAGAHRETAKLDTMMENKARSFDVVVCKLWPLKMLGSSLYTEKQKGETNVLMFILYMNLRIRIIWSSEKAHTLTSVSSPVHFNSYPLNYVTTTKRKENKTTKPPHPHPSAKPTKIQSAI